MELNLVEVDNGYWIVEDSFGKWFGDGMLLRFKDATLLLKAMEHAYATGYEAAQANTRKALGMDW